MFHFCSSSFVVNCPQFLNKSEIEDGHHLEINSNIGRYGKKTEMFFFSTEATNLIKLKLYMHKYWMSLYKIMFFMWVGKQDGNSAI